jgi:ABC-type transporter Mla maintaining outer membrane lipid asymmetry ATPase subunit MlaF
MVAIPPIEITGVRKRYAGLRPLRIESLTVGEAERVAVAGLDGAAAEVLVNLLTGATLPDEGEVRLFGRATSDIADEREWLVHLDRCGIVTGRAALLEALTVRQNLTLPLTIEIDAIPPGIDERVARLGREVGFCAEQLEARAGELPASARWRVRLARALALDPSVLILEHPTALVERPDVARLAADVVRVATSRGLAALVISEDREFARAVAPTRLRLDGATGQLGTDASWWRWRR